MATDLRTVDFAETLTLLKDNHYIRCKDGYCEVVRRPDIPGRHCKRQASVDIAVVDILLKRKHLRQLKANNRGWRLLVDSSYVFKRKKVKPRLCRACGKTIIDATQNNQVYHKNQKCQAIKKIQFALRQREYQRKITQANREENLRNPKPRVKKVRQKCLGPAAGTHYFLTDKPHLEHICPLCKSIQAGRTGGLDDANGVVF